MIDPIRPEDFNRAICLLRDFFSKNNFIEMHVQHRLSVLAACEDPITVSSFDYAGQIWPLPQTGQMWLEHELLKNPLYKKLFCVSTSFRNEPTPVPGRHSLIFPMFEFEFIGGINDLLSLEVELCDFLGLSGVGDFRYQFKYEDVCQLLGKRFIDASEEMELRDRFGRVIYLTHFPERTSPFWNMCRAPDGTSHKIDVIIDGMETIGSAERSCDSQDMRERFHTISGGRYADMLFAKFGRERVIAELEEFLALPMIPRVGGGIGITRLIRALEGSDVL